MRFPILRAWLAAALVATALPALARAALTGLTITGESFTYDAPDGRVTGRLKMPTGTAPFPAVLLSHGKGGTAANMMTNHGPLLAAAGLVVIAPDYTHAGSAVNPPDNEGYCPENSRRARACLAILASLGSVDLSRVGAFGHSMGSYLTAGLLGENGIGIRAAVISAGGTSNTTNTAYAAPATTEVQGIVTPLLMFHGTLDTTVSPTQSAALADLLAAHGTPYRRVLYAGVNHDIINVKKTDLHALLRAWFTSHGILASATNTTPTLTAPASLNVTAGTTSSPAAIAIGDAQTTPASLSVSAFTTDDAQLPAAGIALGGNGAARTLTVTPAAAASGSIDVALVVTDGELSAAQFLTLAVSSGGGAGGAVNFRPEVSWIADKRTTPGVAVNGIAFTIADAETAAGALAVTVVSSNPTLLPDAAITLGGSGANRTVSLAPAAGQSGVATITLTVSDGTKTTATAFTLTAAATIAGNTAPAIQGVASDALPAGAAAGPIPLVVKDTESTESALTLSAASSNPAVVPVANIVFGGQNWGRAVTVTPTSGATGRTTLTFTVSDGTLTASTACVLEFVAGDLPPTLTGLPTFVARAHGDAPNALGLTVGDDLTATSSLRVTAATSNATLLPASAVTLGGAGASRTLTLTPLDVVGASTVTLTVSDGTYSRRKSVLVVGHDPSAPAEQFDRPRGVFALDSSAGGSYTTTFGKVLSLRDAGIRDLPCVDGFTLRVAWDDCESGTAPGSYDFKVIANALAKLPAGQQLSLILMTGEPAYVAGHAGAQTWNDGGTVRAVPWDPYLRERRRAFITALAASTAGGVALRDEPRLTILNPDQPGGFNGVRDPNSTALRNLPGYSRAGFLAALQDELRAWQDALPGRFVQIGFWPVLDAENGNYGGVTAWEWWRQQLLAEFNGVARPRIGLFMDNLAAKRTGPEIDPFTATPVTGFAGALAASRDDAWNGFQMLGSWARPFNDSHVNATLNGTPADAHENAFNTYGAEYVEVYGSDLDTAGYLAGLQRWHDFYVSRATTNDAADDDADGLPLGWERGHGLAGWRTGAGGGANDDPDGDGLSNLLEYATVLDPRHADLGSAAAFALPAPGGALDFTFRRRTDAPWLQYAVETSTDLTAWTVDSTAGLAIPAGDGLSEWFTVRLTPPAGAGAWFARLRVTHGATAAATSVPLAAATSGGGTGARLTALSVRARAGTGDKTLVVGLAVAGGEAQPLLVRAAGPALRAYGVGDALADPQLRLFDVGRLQIATNDDWTGSAALAAATQAVGLAGFAEGSRDAAWLGQLAPGTFTAHVVPNGAGGVALVEAYATAAPAGARLAALSSRNEVGGGDDVLVAGFAIGGEGTCTVLVRGVGPTLAGFGVGGALPDPRLVVYAGTQPIAGNDDWGNSPALAEAAQRAGTFALPDGSRDAALLATLGAGAYTVQLSGGAGAGGVGLLELYQVL